MKYKIKKDKYRSSCILHVQYDTTGSVGEELNNMTEDELDFIEREVFFAYDDAFRAYHQEDLDTRSAIALYERALDTIRAIRTVRDEMTEKELETAKNIHKTLQ